MCHWITYSPGLDGATTCLLGELTPPPMCFQQISQHAPWLKRVHVCIRSLAVLIKKIFRGADSKPRPLVFLLGRRGGRGSSSGGPAGSEMKRTLGPDTDWCSRMAASLGLLRRLTYFSLGVPTETLLKCWKSLSLSPFPCRRHRGLT